MKHKVKITLTIMLILISALIWAVRPQPVQAMRRESRIQPATLEEALRKRIIKWLQNKIAYCQKYPASMADKQRGYEAKLVTLQGEATNE